MPKEYYQQLGMNLGDARSRDKKPKYNPLLASDAKAQNGDTTRDSIISVTDATIIQWYLAELSDTL